MRSAFLQRTKRIKLVNRFERTKKAFVRVKVNIFSLDYSFTFLCESSLFEHRNVQNNFDGNWKFWKSLLSITRTVLLDLNVSLQRSLLAFVTTLLR